MLVKLIFSDFLLLWDEELSDFQLDPHFRIIQVYYKTIFYA